MKNFIIALLLGIVLGAAGLRLWQRAGETPMAQEIEHRVEEASAQAVNTATNATRDMSRAVASKLEALQLRAADLREELERSGEIVRRRARALGSATMDATADTRATLAIEAKLAADPDLSALAIEVNTTNGHVTLSGTAPSLDLIGQAILLAMETEGVDAVTSTLQVG